LIVDTLRYLPALAEILAARGAADPAERLAAVRVQVARVFNAFGRLAESRQFREACPWPLTAPLADLAADLVREAWRLEHMLEPAERQWPDVPRAKELHDLPM